VTKSERTAIHASWVLTGYESGKPHLVPDATVVISDGRIDDIVTTYPPDQQQIRLPDNSVIVPGLVDTHTHALNGPLFRGMTEDWDRGGNQGTLVYDLLMPVGDRAASMMSPSEARAVYTLSLLNTLKGGTTTVLDMFRLPRATILDAARDVGLRIYGAPYLASRSISGVDAQGNPITATSDESAQLDNAVSIFHEYDEGPDGRIRLMLGPHCTDTCTPEFLKTIMNTARELDIGVTIHVAQSRPEVAIMKATYGLTPVEYLMKHGVSGGRVIAAHCAFATDDDLGLLASTGTPVASCPATFAHGGHSVDFNRFAQAGVITGLGTDGHSVRMLDELRIAGFVSKLAGASSGTRQVTSADILRTATEGGAATLGRNDLGTLHPGARADLTAFVLDGPQIQPVLDPISKLIWHHGGASTSLVVVDGEILVKDGHHVRIDEERVEHEASAAIRRIWESHFAQDRL
jgi:5-methylthioadenosine/S-adenosylhomocysteine deaminase